jgi:hypothetical protein
MHSLDCVSVAGVDQVRVSNAEVFWHVTISIRKKEVSHSFFAAVRSELKLEHRALDLDL